MSNKKKVLFNKEAESPILKGVEVAANAVKSTHGARGRTVLIESDHHTENITATKDGVTVLRSIHLKDNTQDLGVRLLRQAASKTVKEAGDGTTTATSLVWAIVSNAREMIGSHNNVVEVIRHIENYKDEVVDKLEKSSIPADNDIVKYVATVSANNDDFIGKVISDAYSEVGRDGVVIHQPSKNHETYFEVTDGMRMDRGLMSPRHVTNFKNITCELDNPYILVTDLKVPSIVAIQKIVEKALKEARPILIIGEMEFEAMATFDKNIEEGILKGAYVIPPQFGSRREDVMSDIAVALGATYITSKTGSNWSTIGPECLGKAEKVIVSRTSTTVKLKPDEKVKSIMDERVAMLKDQIKLETQDSEIEILRERIANLQGKIATVFVGARTDVEQKEKVDRVDDSIRATQAAIANGVCPGGGIAYIDAIGRPSKLFPKNSMLQSIFPFYKPEDSDSAVAIKIMQKSLTAPFSQILENAGKNPADIYKELPRKEGYGYDVRAEEIGNMINLGIIDPTKVMVSALSNAVSTATTIIMTSAVIANDN